MMSSNLIEILKVELDYRGNTILSNCIILKNKTEKDLILYNEETKYSLLGSETIIIKFNLQNFNLKIFPINDSSSESLENLNYDFSKFRISGFGMNSLIETPNGKKKIKNLKSGDLVYDRNLNNIKIKCLIIFKINKESKDYSKYFPVSILKNNCGLNLPKNDLELTINEILFVKKNSIKTRHLFLNKKGKEKSFNNEYNIYNIVTENKNNYYAEGFILNSFNEF